MPNILPIPPDRLCLSTTVDGGLCQAVKLRGKGTCRAHSDAAGDMWHAKGLVVPSDSLDTLAHLDLTEPDHMTRARTGVWQHLLAGSMPPHVAKVALDVAETIAKGAKASDTGASVTASVAAVLRHAPPQLDE